VSEFEEGRRIPFRKIGAFSAAAIALICIAELIVVAVCGLPPILGSAENWLAALQPNRFLGIVRTLGLDIILVALYAPLYLSLFFLLRTFRKGYPTLILSIAFSFIGIAVYFATNPTFSMLYLSDRLAAATTEVQRNQVLDSARTLIALWNGTGPIAATILAGLSGLLVSIVMLQSRKFRPIVAIAGIIGNALQLGPPVSIMPPAYPLVDPYLIMLGALALLFWFVGIALRLFRAQASE
jgi:hypothetical protein